MGMEEASMTTIYQQLVMKAKKKEVVSVEDQMFPFMVKEGKIKGRGIMMIKSLKKMHPNRKSYSLRTGK